MKLPYVTHRLTLHQQERILLIPHVEMFSCCWSQHSVNVMPQLVLWQVYDANVLLFLRAYLLVWCRKKPFEKLTLPQKRKINMKKKQRHKHYKPV